MSTAVLGKHLADAHGMGHNQDHAHDSDGNTVPGFWLYLMTDYVLFASAFIICAVSAHYTTGDPSGKSIFELPYVLVGTVVLLVSGCTYGLTMLSAHKDARGQATAWLGVIFLLGTVFIGIEISEFHHLIAEGFGPSRSASPSSFFTLVGMHGLHVGVGLSWMLVLIVQIWTRDPTAQNNTRVVCLSLFWHLFDIVWICILTVVYLMGAP